MTRRALFSLFASLPFVRKCLARDRQPTGAGLPWKIGTKNEEYGIRGKRYLNITCTVPPGALGVSVFAESVGGQPVLLGHINADCNSLSIAAPDCDTIHRMYLVSVDPTAYATVNCWIAS